MRIRDWRSDVCSSDLDRAFRRLLFSVLNRRMCDGNCRVMPGRRNELGLRRHEGFQVVEGRGAVDAGADDEMEEVCPDDVAIRCGPGPETKNGPLPSDRKSTRLNSSH